MGQGLLECLEEVYLEELGDSEILTETRPWHAPLDG
jgi:hypothetical protein